MSFSIEAYTEGKADQVVDLWDESMPVGFHMDLRLWRQNVDRCDRLSASASLIAVDSSGSKIIGFVISKLPNHISALAVLPEYRRCGVGRALIDAALSALASAESLAASVKLTSSGQPPTHAITGQDYAHFFPGVPDSFTEARAFFDALGWNRSDGWCVDLKRDLQDFVIAPEVSLSMERLRRDGIELRPCALSDVPALYDHVRENFSPRWLFETQQRVELEPDPSEIMIAVLGDKVIGFAHTFTNRSVKLGPSVYWRAELGENYGGLGPIGVSKDYRKIGLGLALLSYGVWCVKQAGAALMAIDWTVLVDFYGRLGFQPWRRFTPYTKEISK